jgi:hypothetical protein
VGHRYPGERRRCDRACHAWDDLERHTGVAERKRFLASSPQDERVPAFEPHDTFPLTRTLNHQPLDRGLSDRHVTCPLSDTEALSAGCEGDELETHQRVVQDEVCGAQATDGPERQQFGIAGPGAYQ